MRDWGRGVWVHGAGGFGRKLARTLASARVPVLGFLDRLAADLREVEGIRVLHPDALTDRDVADACHLHGLMNHATPSRDVSVWASNRGFAGLRFPVDLHRLPGVDLRHYWLAPAADTLEHLDAIEAVHDGLDDEESRSLLRQLLWYRITSDPRRHPRVDLAGTYVPDFLPIRGRALTFVDGGAFTGDTLEALLHHGVTVRDWIAFEPDRSNFDRLRATAQRCRGRLDAFTLLQLGLSDSNGRVAFSDGEGAASHVAGAGDGSPASWIDVVRLDDVVARRGDIYVKLDIEGAELAALHGMTALLGEAPTLAVSLYHKPADLWEIPLHLMARHRSARFRLRQHGHHGFDTVLYVYSA